MTAADVCSAYRRDLAHMYLTTGRVRITGLWPRALDAEISSGARLHYLTVRPTTWRCSCGRNDRSSTFCAHALAVRLVAGDSIPGPFTQVWP